MIPNIYQGDYRKLIIFPLILIAISLYFIPQIKLGVDFQGGTLIIIDLKEKVNPDQLTADLAKDGIIGTVKTYTTSFGDKAELEIQQNPDLVKADALNDQFNTQLDATATLEAKANANSTYMPDYLAQRAILDNTSNSLLSLAGQTQNASQVDNLNTLKTQVSVAYRSVYNNYKDSISKSIDKYVKYSSFSVQSVSPTLSAQFLGKAELAIFLAFLLSTMLIYVLFYQHDTISILKLGAFGALILILGFVYQIFLVHVALLLILLLVLLFYFKSLPSVAVVIGAISDILIALGGMGLFGIPLTLASFAALLMILGFSLDTDILLTMRVFKRAGDPREKAFDSMKTGLTMSTTALFAFIILFIISLYTHIAIYSEISGVALAGLVGDMFATWGINAVLVLQHAEGKI